MDIFNFSLEDSRKRLIEIDNSFSKVSLPRERLMRIQDAHNALNNTIDPLLNIIIIHEVFQLCSLHEYADHFVELIDNYPTAMKWLYERNVSNMRDDIHELLRIATDPDAKQVIKDFINHVNKFTTQLSKIKMEKSILAKIKKLNVKNSIHIIGLSNIKDNQKLSLISEKINIKDSNDIKLLEYIKDIQGIEKLYHNGTLELTNESCDVFNDDLLSKIIN